MQEETQPKHSDEALRASELRYRRLFEAAQDGILILNAKTGQIDDVNPFLVNLLGYTHDEFIGLPLWEIGPFKDVKECKLAFEELQDKEYIRYESLPLETKGGRPIAVEFVSNVYRLNGDGTRVIQCNIRDITKRKHAEDALHHSLQQTRSFFEANPAGSYVASPDGRLITCNSAFARMLGFASVEEAMKVDLVSLYPDRASRDGFLGRLKKKGWLEYNEAELRRKDGSVVHAVENAAGTFDERGELAEIQGCLMDASERQTEPQLRQAPKQPPFHIKTFLSKAGAGRTIVYVPGKQVLFEQGKPGNAVFYILTGMVKLTVASHGKEITIDLLGPGNFAGKECMATVRPRSTASARTLTNCTILRIEREEMLRVIQQEKTFAAFFLDHLLDRNSRYQEVIKDQLLNSGEKRLARALLLLANFGNGGKPEAIVPRIRQEELAEMVGTTRSRINFFMNRFRKLGFVAYQGKTPMTIHTAKLARFVMA
ncbi:MAG TPA: PAS domain S-box protein [Terriglobales bacterium]|nr:PAS domain S-box protein [Terriglobales bacterium]